jgi:hypothetical protein
MLATAEAQQRLEIARARQHELASMRPADMDFRTVAELRGLKISIPELEHDAEEARLDALRRRVMASATYGHTYSGGVEEMWLKGVIGPRMIHGIATTPTVSSNMCSVSSEGCTVRLPTPLFCDHDNGLQPIGSVFHFRKSSAKIYVRATIDEGRAAADYAWKLIQLRELTCLSVATENGAQIDAVVDGVRFYKAWRLKEVSVCRQGANPDCRFAIYAD